MGYVHRAAKSQIQLNTHALFKRFSKWVLQTSTALDSPITFPLTSSSVSLLDTPHLTDLKTSKCPNQTLESLFHHKYLLCQFIQLHGFLHQSLHWWLTNIQSGPVPLAFSTYSFRCHKGMSHFIYQNWAPNLPPWTIFLNSLNDNITPLQLLEAKLANLTLLLYIPHPIHRTCRFSNTWKYIQKSEGFLVAQC